MSAVLSEETITSYETALSYADLSRADRELLAELVSSHREANTRIAELDVQLLKCRNVVAMLRDLTAERVTT